jgi:hypothetical protein
MPKNKPSLAETMRRFSPKQQEMLDAQMREESAHHEPNPNDWRKELEDRLAHYSKQNPDRNWAQPRDWDEWFDKQKPNGELHIAARCYDELEVLHPKARIKILSMLMRSAVDDYDVLLTGEIDG